MPGASHPWQESFLHQVAVGGRLVLHWDWKRGDLGAGREEDKNSLPSFFLLAMALVTTGGLFLTISETKGSSVGYKMRVSLPGEAVVKSGRV